MAKLTEKVAIFSGGDADGFGSLQTAVNKWLGKHPNINIVSRKVTGGASHTGCAGAALDCVIVIFYTED